MTRDRPSKEHGHLPKRTWMWAIVAIALLAVHGSILHYVLSHAALSTGIVLAVMAVIVVKHLGLLGPGYVLLRRYLRRDRR